MSFWSDMEDRSIGESIRTEDEILTKERLVEALKSIPMRQSSERIPMF